MTAIDDRPSDSIARSPGITYQELLDTDTHPVPEALRAQSPRDLGTDDISIHKYIDREYHLAERDQLWMRVWQFACREEHIATVGDYIIYDIAGLSFIVINTESGIKAYPNACLHRGRQLKDYDGHCSEIRCPFHGFAWTNEGDLSDVPADWDFPQIDGRRDTDFHLPECKVDTWAGFVFINPDPDAGSLADHLGGLVEHFEIWDLGNRYVEAHVSKLIAANWKVAQEAFSEAYHVNATHPQIMPYIGDTNSQVDVWDTFSRVITPGGTPSPLLDWEPTQDDIIRSMLDVRIDQQSPISIAEGQTARAAGAAASRQRWRPIVGDAVDTMSDAEMMDSLDYTVFPNFHPWGAFNRIVYRFRPNGTDHRSAIMECIFLSPFDGDRPPPAQVHHLGFDDKWTDAPELGMLAKVFEQDTFNMGKVQRGLETTFKPGITLSRYQESKVRWLHDKLDEYVDAPPPSPGPATAVRVAGSRS